jgi:hypothetical protein
MSKISRDRLEDMQSYCKNLYYNEREGYWSAFVSDRYHQELEVYIAGNSDGLNPILEQAAIHAVKNIGLIESRVKAYLAQVELTTFKPSNATLSVDPYPNTEDLWHIKWLNFCNVNQLDQFEAVCSLNDDPLLAYIYMLWVVTLQNDIPISHHGEFW